MERYIENPNTGRLIKMKGQLYKDLKAEGAKFDKKTVTSKRISTPKKQISPKRRKLSDVKVMAKKATSGVKGWREVSPKRGVERNELMKKCGQKCFLDPERKAYPICQKYKGECKVDCRGVLAAKIRASEWKQYKIAEEANKIGKRLNCNWL